MRIRWFAELFIAHHECFVDQYAVGLQPADQMLQSWPEQIVRDDDAIELTRPIRPLTVFKVYGTSRDPAYSRQCTQSLLIFIDGFNLIAKLGQQTRMTTSAAGQIKNRTATWYQCREAAYPRQRRLRTM